MSEELPLDDGVLRVGAASVDITPDRPRGMFLAGFASGRTAIGVLDPIEASAVYISLGGEEVALVTVDAIGFTRPTVRKMRAAVRSMERPTDIIVCATHTHSAPDTLGMWGPALLGFLPRRSGVDPAWMSQLIAGVATAVDTAKARAQPAMMRAATFDVPERWTRNDRKAGGRYDMAGAVAFDAAEGGERLATLLNFASHPEGLWEKNRLVSADFPGFFRRRAREISPGSKLYFSGPLGGMLTPNIPEGSGQGDRHSYIEELGVYLAEMTERALAAAAPSTATELEHHVKVTRFTNDNWRFSMLQRMGIIHAEIEGKEFASEVHRLRLGDVDMLTAPGEVLPELGQRIRGRMSMRHRLLLGLAIDEVGYILEPRMFDDREYRYERTMSLGRGTADTLMAAYDELLSR